MMKLAAEGEEGLTCLQKAVIDYVKQENLYQVSERGQLMISLDWKRVEMEEGEEGEREHEQKVQKALKLNVQGLMVLEVIEMFFAMMM